jgi:hypothetical protein
MFLTTFSIPGLYGRWSVETKKPNCPQEIVLSKHRYNSGISYAERTDATLTNFDSNQQVSSTTVYSVEHIKGDWYTFNPYETDTVIPNVIKVRLSFEGRRLIFKKEKNKTTCTYRLKADYEHMGRELFGNVYS